MLNNLPGVTSVHGRFYDLSSKYYRIIGNHASYYKDALRYLGCVDVKDLSGNLFLQVAREEKWILVQMKILPGLVYISLVLVFVLCVLNV